MASTCSTTNGWVGVGGVLRARERPCKTCSRRWPEARSSPKRLSHLATQLLEHLRAAANSACDQEGCWCRKKYKFARAASYDIGMTAHSFREQILQRSAQKCTVFVLAGPGRASTGECQPPAKQAGFHRLPDRRCRDPHRLTMWVIHTHTPDRFL